MFDYFRTLSLAATLPFIGNLAAQLPMLEPPWLGYFAVAEETKYQLLIPSVGEPGIFILNKDAVQIANYPITLQFLAIETLPDGSERVLAMKMDTVESTDLPTAKLKKTVFRAKLTEEASGQPTLEVTLENSGGNILASARITDKGAFNKNPILPEIRLCFHGYYGEEQAAKGTWEKKQVKDFERMLEKDFVRLKHLDGETVKLACNSKPELKSNEINGNGSSLIEIDIGAYQGRKLELIAAPNSSLTLWNAGAAPLHAGFWLQWSADPVKDPEGKAKLAIRIK